ncbi:hypothetical protein BDZ85DRAFT_64715 [Elsinoe ampelina]|uniref:Uncharacterized protein n=1 Tax=Elsinoe ampelina TaxID=302913 RepID=A0A6A6FZM7_9PEZI|nr:hypothetical protein BDZ85DRAFT_64715 [Elsinoe ampelina]
MAYRSQLRCYSLFVHNHRSRPYTISEHALHSSDKDLLYPSLRGLLTTSIWRSYCYSGYAQQFSFVLVARTRAQDDLQRHSTTSSTNDTSFPSNKTAITLLVLHATLCIFWAILAGQPRDDWLDLPFVTIMGINAYGINPIITVVTGIASALQVRTTRVSQGPSALNPMTLLPCAVVSLVLAVSWPFRFKLPHNLKSHGQLWLLEEWYPLVGWTCVNNAVIAMGQCITLYVMMRKSDSGVQLNGERQALLA